MTNNQKFQTQIRELIAADALSEAVDLLQQLLKDSPKLDEAIQQAGRLSDLSRQVRLGLVDPQEASVSKNQIRAALLELLDGISAQENALPEAKSEPEQLESGKSTIQNAEKIYNIEKIEKANFS